MSALLKESSHRKRYRVSQVDTSQSNKETLTKTTRLPNGRVAQTVARRTFQRAIAAARFKKPSSMVTGSLTTPKKNR